MLRRRARSRPARPDGEGGVATAADGVPRPTARTDRRHGLRDRIAGVDVSSEMVRAAQAKVRAAGVAVPFAVGDAATPPWCDGAFDVVLARHVVWALPSPEDVIRRWLALLAPGGRLMLIEGRWYTGAGIAAHDLSDVVRAAGAMTRLTTLGDARLWGGPTADVRYLMVCTRPGR